MSNSIVWDILFQMNFLFTKGIWLVWESTTETTIHTIYNTHYTIWMARPGNVTSVKSSTTVFRQSFSEYLILKRINLRRKANIIQVICYFSCFGVGEGQAWSWTGSDHGHSKDSLRRNGLSWWLLLQEVFVSNQLTLNTIIENELHLSICCKIYCKTCQKSKYIPSDVINLMRGASNRDHRWQPFIASFKTEVMKINYFQMVFFFKGNNWMKKMAMVIPKYKILSSIKLWF